MSVFHIMLRLMLCVKPALIAGKMSDMIIIHFSAQRCPSLWSAWLSLKPWLPKVMLYIMQQQQQISCKNKYKSICNLNLFLFCSNLQGLCLYLQGLDPYPRLPVSSLEDNTFSCLYRLIILETAVIIMQKKKNK